MENITCSTKRKKRRTRRCLDEIRNRLRSKCGNSYEHSLTKTQSLKLGSKKLENRLVTMDRLTLKAMFPNAIRSETITRPVLEEIKQKQRVNYRDVKKPFSLDQEFQCENVNASLDNIRSFDECGDNTMSKEINQKNEELKSSSSSALFSPAGFSKSIAPNKYMCGQDAVASSTLLCRSLDDRNHRYKELINEIPSYITHFTSSINKEETTKKTIHNLLKLYMESCKNEYKDNRSNSRHISTSNNRIFVENQLIVENPLDYIRFEHERQQSNESPVEPLSSSMSPNAGPAHSPASSCASPADISVRIVPYDTPDYTYYAHPLK